MSYSFSVAGATKADVKSKLAEAFDNVVKNQPSHEADRAAALACGEAFVDMLREPGEGDEVSVSVYGSLSWPNEKPGEFYSGNVSVTAGVKPAA